MFLSTKPAAFDIIRKLRSVRYPVEPAAVTVLLLETSGGFVYKWSYLHFDTTYVVRYQTELLFSFRC